MALDEILQADIVETLEPEVDGFKKGNALRSSTIAQIRDALEEPSKKVKPLTNQEKREVLTPEFLSSLTTNEYIALWRRLNPYYLTHVTRQGFRDHTSHHNVGRHQFHTGFTNIIEDDKAMRPALYLGGLKTRDKAAVKAYLTREEVFEEPSIEEAQSRLFELFREGPTLPSYADKTAVHFASQYVSDGDYGAEGNNEIFTVYPVDVIASQNSFTNISDFTNSHRDPQWNDVFVWPTSAEEPSISLDVGIVFLPKKTLVDPKTGSKYHSEQNSENEKTMVVDNELVDKFLDWAVNLSQNAELSKAYSEYENALYDQEEEMLQNVMQIIAKGLQELGFLEEVVTTLSNEVLHKIRFSYDKLNTSRDSWREFINDTTAKWKRAVNAIPAKKYWKRYFAENPHLKPKHIVYYTGDPNKAILRFQRKNGIGEADTSKTEGKLLGFDDKKVTDPLNDPRSNRGLAELEAMASEIIEEYYSS